ncbi:hypothetical protein SNEBB_010909 [Seison nebaliae]|nr:hypothetical protein SNEBB_010909 [Seison nebaliae]
MVNWEYALGYHLVYYVQHFFYPFRQLLFFVSSIGDPKNVFIYYFPFVLFFVDRWFALFLLVCAAGSEWLNSILKWILFEDRPYWWLIEHKNSFQVPKSMTLYQFPMTCETGPGAPSGHLMVTMSVWWLIYHRYGGYRKLLSKFILFFASLFLCISRVFLAAHFVHQVIGGAMLAILFGEVLQHLIWKQYGNLAHFFEWANSTKFFIILGICSMLIATGFFNVLLLMNIDPLWSVSKAMTYCYDRQWIHLNTTLLYSVMRDGSIFVGIGIYLHYRLKIDDYLKKRTISLRMTKSSKTIFLYVIVITAFLCNEKGDILDMNHSDLLDEAARSQFDSERLCVRPLSGYGNRSGCETSRSTAFEIVKDEKEANVRVPTVIRKKAVEYEERRRSMASLEELQERDRQYEKARRREMEKKLHKIAEHESHVKDIQTKLRNQNISSAKKKEFQKRDKEDQNKFSKPKSKFQPVYD